jgi:hypothetical protein
MASSLKAMLAGGFANDRIDTTHLKFNHDTACLAVQVVVVRITVIMLVTGSSARFVPAQKSGINQLG